MIDKEIGIRIRKQRELMGYTREELSEIINISPKFCADIELGVKGMSIETLCKLSDELLVSTDYILFGKSSYPTDDEMSNIVSLCPQDKIKYLKEVVRGFVKACR